MSSIDTSDPAVMRDRLMISVAKRRGIVRLRNGQLATLISWGSSRGGRSVGSGRRCRLEGCDGETRWTADKNDIIEVVDDDY